MQIRLHAILTLCFICFFITSSFAANSIRKKSSELKYVNHRIITLRNNLNHDKVKKASLHSALKKTDAQLKKISRQLHSTQQQLRSEEIKLHHTNQSLAQHEAKLLAQKKILSKEIEAAYILGREPSIKIILNQQDPEKLSRYLRYYAYINQARYLEIENIKKNVINIHSLAHTLKKQQYKLEATRHQEEKQAHVYSYEKHQRKILLGKLNLKIQHNSSELNKLETDKKRLQNTINTLRQQLAYGYAPGATFSKMHHQLIFPLKKGQIIQHYGQLLAQGHIRSTGILIRPEQNNQVHAVFPGKVIFANSLKDFGLIVILQHGKNYMSLYGHNENLYVKTGQMVKAGQIIATLNKNEHGEDGDLYFEIRYKRKPLNPALWFKKI